MQNKIVVALIVAVAIYITFFYREADGVDDIKADMIIHNTTLYTANDDQKTAQAVAVKGDKIIFVGSNEDVQTFIGDNTNVLDMAGNTV
jgi:imidazolonepropionase-like amidohydrolase